MGDIWRIRCIGSVPATNILTYITYLRFMTDGRIFRVFDHATVNAALKTLSRHTTCLNVTL